MISGNTAGDLVEWTARLKGLGWRITCSRVGEFERVHQQGFVRSHDRGHLVFQGF